MTTAPADTTLGQPGSRPPRRVMQRVLLEQWQAGRSLMALERMHRMAHRTVRQLLEEAGADLPPRRDMFALRGPERVAFAKALAAEYDATPMLTVHALAKRHHVSPQTARKLLNEARQLAGDRDRQARGPASMRARTASMPTLAELCGLDLGDTAEDQLQQQAEPGHATSHGTFRRSGGRGPGDTGQRRPLKLPGRNPTSTLPASRNVRRDRRGAKRGNHSQVLPKRPHPCAMAPRPLDDAPATGHKAQLPRVASGQSSNPLHRRGGDARRDDTYTTASANADARRDRSIGPGCQRCTEPHRAADI